ncbi:hypothetical protein ZIOFF_055909 [Zingiber officinale]|uniref:Thylakoid membrane protein TERC, chloroplastic n=1 Tax=Zingiber officinale TaxID=94328 RepID=A0A8J5KKP7_ZINOF|nr:hypothetical protein ZIOFF_055909 [Zingiber officinale]
MAFASAIHHRPWVRAPLMFDPGRLGGSSVSSLRRHALAAAPRDPGVVASAGFQLAFRGRKGLTKKTSRLRDKEKNNSSSHDEVNIIGVAIRDPVSGGTESTLADKSSSMKTVALWVFAASAFGICLGFKDGIEKASEFFAGYAACGMWLMVVITCELIATRSTNLTNYCYSYILEQSLSVDNLFVFVLIFSYFKVPVKCQSQVLSYGIAGAIIFRAVVILLGTATIQRFELVNVLLALILLFSSYKVIVYLGITDYYDGDRFFTIKDGVRKATPLLLALAVVELSDIAFAVDSIPAVFGVTRDPFIVFSSNLFAICGLRSLYVLISESMSEMEYLQPAIGVVLGFIGTKMLFDFFGYHVSTEASLCFVAITLGTGVLLSLRKNQSD